MTNDVKFLTKNQNPEDTKSYREKISHERKALTEKLWHQQGNCCYYCGVKTRFVKFQKGHRPEFDFATLEHLVPQCQGGTDDITNVVMSCFHCNMLRSALNVGEFQEFCQQFLSSHSNQDFEMKRKFFKQYMRQRKNRI